MNAPSPSAEVTAVIPDLKGEAVLITGASTSIAAAAARYPIRVASMTPPRLGG